MTTGRINQVSTACGPRKGSAVPRGCRGQGGRIDPQLPPPERGRAARSRKKPRAPDKSPPPPGGPRARSVSLAFRDSQAPVCATALATVRPERRPNGCEAELTIPQNGSSPACRGAPDVRGSAASEQRHLPPGSGGPVPATWRKRGAGPRRARAVMERVSATPDR